MSSGDHSIPSSLTPTVTITEQPAQIYRFRYVSEIDKARFFGSLPGASTNNRSYPAIRLDGYQGPYAVLLSLINSENNYVHPHTVRGTDPRYICTNGTIYVITETPEVVFNNIGIICVKEKTEVDVREALTKRQEITVDPFRAGYAHLENHSLIDFTAVRLCFQVFLPDNDWTPADMYDPTKYSTPLEPVTSTVVYDAKKYGDLKIRHVSSCAGPLSGGTEMNLWCEKKFTGQNPDVVFCDKRGWTQKAKVTEYHKQLVMRFDAPPYPNYKGCNCAEKVEVYVYLEQSSKRGVSRSLSATVAYLPNNKKKNPPSDYLDKIKEKSKAWKRYRDNSKIFDSSAMPSTSSQTQRESPSSAIQVCVNYDDTSSSGLDPNSNNNKFLSSSDENSSQSMSFHSTQPFELNDPSLSLIYDFDQSMSTTNSQNSGEPDPIAWHVQNTPICFTDIEARSSTTTLNTSEILSEILDMENKINGETGNADLANVDNFADQIFPINDNHNLLRNVHGNSFIDIGCMMML